MTFFKYKNRTIFFIICILLAALFSIRIQDKKQRAPSQTFAQFDVATPSATPTLTSTPTPTSTICPRPINQSCKEGVACGYIFIDTNRNNELDLCEVPYGGRATIQFLYQITPPNPVPVADTTSDSEGYYEFDYPPETQLPLSLLRLQVPSGYESTGFNPQPIAARERNDFGIILSVGTCTLKARGDADCNGEINLLDANRWRDEFHRILSSKTADFNGDGAVTPADYIIWKGSYVSI